MKYLTVERGEMRTVSLDDTVKVLATFDLGADIVLTCYNPVMGKVGLARGVQNEHLTMFIKKFLSSEDVSLYPVLDVRLVGGDNSEKSREEVRRIVALLAQIDQDRDILNIVSSDINEEDHPQAFAITAFDGEIGDVVRRKL
jgi:hypothetical protein